MKTNYSDLQKEYALKFEELQKIQKELTEIQNTSNTLTGECSMHSSGIDYAKQIAELSTAHSNLVAELQFAKQVDAFLNFIEFTHNQEESRISEEDITSAILGIN